MANTQNAYGFKPWGPTLSIKRYQKDSGASVTYKWDVINMAADGGVDPATAGQTEIVGSAAHNSAASTAADLMVFDDPTQKFECQDDGSATLAQTNIGNMADHVAGTGSSTTKISGHTLNATGASSSAAGFLILDLVQRQGNAFGAYGSMVVVPNEHLHKYITGGAGRAGI